MALVSIIIPVYNAGTRLKKLLDSLCNQTLQDIEFICIVDCPTDGSDKVCAKYAEKDTRIILLFNSTNIGIAASRNRGIEMAIYHQSKYIGFADHDDYLELDAYERMIDAAYLQRGGADVVFANTYIENKYDSTKIYFNDPTWKGMIKSLLLPMELKSNPNYLVRSVWNSIYKTSFVAYHNFRFMDRNIYYEDDTLFNLSIYAKTKHIQYLNTFVYHWVKYDTSTSEIIKKHDEECENILRFLICEWNILSENRLYEFTSDFYIMVSDFLRKYYSVIKNKNKLYHWTLAKLLHDCSFPFLGRYEGLKLFSLKRIKLLLFVSRLKMLYICTH